MGQDRRWPEDQPDQDRQRRRRHDGGDEPHGDPVHQCLDRQLRALRLFDHADDLRQRRLCPDSVGAEGDSPLPVHGTAGDRRALDLVNRHRLAGNHALVDPAFTLHDGAIRRDPFAGPHDDHVTGPQFGQRDVRHLAILFHPRRARLQADQAADRGAGPALGARLHHAAEKDQHDNHRRRLEIDGTRGGRDQPRQEGDEGRKEIGRRGSQRDKAVHVGCAAQQRGVAFQEKAPPRPCQDQRRQNELRDPKRPGPDGHRQPVMEGGEEMPAHLGHEDRRGQRGGKDRGALQLAELCILARACIGAGDGAFRKVRRVARRLGRADQVLRRHRAFGKADTGRFGRQIDLGPDDAGNRLQRLLYPPHAGGAGHVVDPQCDIGDAGGIARAAQRGEDIAGRSTTMA